MKKYIVYLSVIVVSLCSCGKKSTSIQGQIDNNKSEKLLLAYNNIVDTVLIDTDGFFKSDIVIESATYVNLKCKRRVVKLYLKSGEDIDMKFDIDKKNGEVMFSGTASALCYYLHKQTEQKFSGDYYKLEETEFFNRTNELLDKKLKLLSVIEFDKDFKNIENKRIKYKIAGKVLNYPSYYPFHANKEFVYGDAFLHYFDELSLNEEELMSLKEYKNYIFTYIQWISSKNTVVYDPIKQTQIGIDFILKNVSSVKNKNYLLYKLISSYVGRNGIENADSFLSSFNSNCTDINYVGKVNKLVAKWTKIAKGQPSPSFNLEDVNGQEVNLESLRGNYVYIDIWATWCGPCRGEIPHLAKLEEEFHSKDIAFVSISVDKNKEAWGKMVKEDEMGGIQLHAGADCSFVNDYIVRGIPRFILLDKEGKILYSKAERPSGKIKEILNQLGDI